MFFSGTAAGTCSADLVVAHRLQPAELAEMTDDRPNRGASSSPIFFTQPSLDLLSYIVGLRGALHELTTAELQLQRDFSQRTDLILRR